MSRQIEQALLSLMPTQQDLPPTLVELAGSLLAQSRHRASTLKADEEVARLYACAHLACERLKISLDLPPIAPRPPIPPRIYGRLYSHLENILPASSASDRAHNNRLRTPNPKARDVGSSPFSTPRPVPSRATPTKGQSLARFRTKSKASSQTPTKTPGKQSGDNDKHELPAWVKPLGRFICAETNNQNLAPTILAGMETILLPGGRPTTDKWASQNMTALFAAIYFFVTMRVAAMASGEAVTRDSYVPQRNAILALLQQARKELSIPANTDDEAWAGWADLKPADFDSAVEQVNERDWLQDDWYKGIDDIVRAPGNSDAEMQDANDTDSASNLQIRRADTMFQDKYDLLSEKRQAEYVVWKENIMSRIDALLAKNGSMEVDG